MSNYLNHTISYVNIEMEYVYRIKNINKYKYENITKDSCITIGLKQEHNFKCLDSLMCNGVIYRINSIFDNNERMTIFPVYDLNIEDVNISVGDIVTRITYEENKELQNLEICSIGEEDNIQIKEESTCKTQRVICFECKYFTGLNQDCNKTKPECYI